MNNQITITTTTTIMKRNLLRGNDGVVSNNNNINGHDDHLSLQSSLSLRLLQQQRSGGSAGSIIPGGAIVLCILAVAFFLMLAVTISLFMQYLENRKKRNDFYSFIIRTKKELLNKSNHAAKIVTEAKAKAAKKQQQEEQQEEEDPNSKKKKNRNNRRKCNINIYHEPIDGHYVGTYKSKFGQHFINTVENTLYFEENNNQTGYSIRGIGMDDHGKSRIVDGHMNYDGEAFWTQMYIGNNNKEETTSFEETLEQTTTNFENDMNYKHNLSKKDYVLNYGKFDLLSGNCTFNGDFKNSAYHISGKYIIFEPNEHSILATRRSNKNSSIFSTNNVILNRIITTATNVRDSLSNY